jgi:hypothetical protein
MATIVWETVDKIWCHRMEQPAELLEERVYFDDPIPDLGRPHKVRARKCSLGSDCHQLDYACRWAYTNPNHDPFAQK